MATFEQPNERHFPTDDFCRVTFIGFESKVKNFPDDDGVWDHQNVWYEKQILLFAVGGIEGTNKEIKIFLDTQYQNESSLRKALKYMGFVEPQKDLSVHIEPFSKNEAYITENFSLRNRILKFLNSSIGNVYLAKIFSKNQMLIHHRLT